jgi:type III restriction enzyme/adenine-specific DNA-methyltransferase
MIKNIIERNGEVKPNSGVLSLLHRDFADCFNNEGKFDIAKFQSLISDKVDLVKENQGFDFLGKSYAKMLASMESTTVIVPDEEHNSKPENRSSKNIYISGDNLDALKHLVRSYAGQVKCIYIDPPYNTGSDGFVYNDKFGFKKEDLAVKLDIEEEQADRILSFNDGSTCSDAAWMTFMLPRLQKAKEMLADDGVIFISIDDNEQANLKLLCDEVFGPENFIGSIPRITKKSGKSSEAINNNHDYVLVYSRTEDPLFYPLKHNDSGFKHKDEFFEERGYYKLNQTLDYDSLQYSDSLDYPIELEGEIFFPGGSKEDYDDRKAGNHDRADWAWRWSKKKFEFGLENGFIEVKRSKNGSRIYTKTYQKAFIEDNEDGDGYIIDYGERTTGLSTLEFTDNAYSNDNATKDVAKTLGKKIFDHTKPIALIDTICDLCLGENDLVMDFFSGSGTTAEALMWNNAYSKGHRNNRYILVQLQEKVKPGTKAYNAPNNYRTIDQIGMSRINKSAALIRQQTNADIDYGFRHYTLQELPEETIDKLEEFKPLEFVGAEEMLKLMGGKEAVLTTWLCDDHYGLGAEVQHVKLGSYTAYYLDKHLYLLDGGFNEHAMSDLMVKYERDAIDFHPSTIVVFGYSFSLAEMLMLKKNISALKDNENGTNITVDIRY